MTRRNIDASLPSNSGADESDGSRLTGSADSPNSVIFSSFGPTGRAFVGRQNEMREIRDTLYSGLLGRGRVVMIAGDPGIGKTRTAQELAVMARESGARVWWGWCHDGHGSPPYWPWLRPLREHIRQAAPEQLSDELGPGAVDIAEIIPEIKEKLPDLDYMPAQEQTSAGSARFRLFDAITTFLKNVSSQQPLLIVLDDLQWADSSSLRLLEFVAKEINTSPLIIVGTYRDTEVTLGDPLSQALGDLIREQSFQKIELKGLSQSEVGEFVERVSGISPSFEVVEAVHSRTQGNPLFLGEIIGQLRPDEIGTGNALSTPIPEGVRDVIGRRLSPLSDTCKQVLSVASIIGRDFSLELLDELIEEVSVDQLLDALEEALEARLIEELPGQRPRFVFTHPLIEETLVDAVPRARSMRLHMRIAETLERLSESETETYAAEIAHHCAQAEPVMGNEKLIRYSLLAGENALRSYAFEEAERFFQNALNSKARAPIDAETAEILSGLGRAQVLLLERHQIVNAIENLSRAFEYYSTEGYVHKAVDVVQLPISPLPGLRTGASSLISRAMSLENLDPIESGRLWNVYGRVMGVEEGDYDRAKEALTQAFAIAEKHDNEPLKRQALTSSAYVNYLHTRWQESLDNSLEAINLAGHAHDPYAEVIARYVAPLDLITMGSHNDARYHASSILASAERARDSFSLTSACWINEIVARLTGDWETAGEFIERGLKVSPRDPRLLFSGAMLEFSIGNFDGGDKYLNVLLDLLNETPPGPTTACSNPIIIAAISAYITGKEDGRLGVAESAAGNVLSSNYAAGTVAQIARTGLAMLAVVRKDADSSREHYLAMKPHQGTFIAYCLSADRLLGLLAQTIGRFDEAMAHFEDALEFCVKAGYNPESGWINYETAACLVERNHVGDLEKAASMMKEARVVSDRFGLQPLLVRLEALGERIESSEVRPVEYPDGLTAREVEVLGLVAAGKTNREIAEELFISEHTAVRHVSNILSKTRSANRAEAALYASRHNLAR